MSDWSRLYAPGDELKAYAEHLVDKYGVRPYVRFNTKVTSAAFDEDAHHWRLGTRSGDEITARYVIGATGVFNEPRIPDIAGVSDFEGETLHTARWDHDISLKGKRVGIIGTGASAVQVIPEIAPEVEHLTVFQRTPIWCLRSPTARWAARSHRQPAKLPGGMQLNRLASQVFVELTFPTALHFHKFVPISAIGERAGRKFLKEQVRTRRSGRSSRPTIRLAASAPASTTPISRPSTARTSSSRPARSRASRRTR